MPRVSLIALLAVLLLLPATADGSSGVRLRGTVAGKSPSAHRVAVKASRQMFALRVPGTLAAIRAGQRVELRGSTLRARGHGSRVLATGVSVASSRPLATAPSSSSSSEDADDDEREITGTLTSLSPVTVASGSQAVSCALTAGMSLTGLAIGDLVEMECYLVGNTWVVREIHAEDEDENGAAQGDDDEDENEAAQGDDDDDDDDSSGPGSGDDDDEDDD